MGPEMIPQAMVDAFVQGAELVEIPGMRDQVRAGLVAALGLAAVEPGLLSRTRVAGIAAFTAYWALRGGVAHNGEPIPRWSELQPDMQAAWVASAAYATLISRQLEVKTQ